MRKRSVGIYILIFVAVFIIALVVMGIMVKTRVDIITKESEKIAAMDIYNEGVDENIYTSGKYAVVEGAIKNYISSYLDNLNNLENIGNNDTLAAMLGIDNLKADGPNFVSSKEYLEKIRKHVDDLASDLKNASKEETILSSFYNKGLNFFFNWIYKKQMLETISTGFYYSDETIDKIAEGVKASLDAKEAVLDFLIQNQSGWVIEGDKLQFETDELLARYQELIAAI